MTTPEFTRTRKSSGDGWEDRWILSGSAGAVEYHQLRQGMALGIVVHSRTPQCPGEEPSCDCGLFGDADCYPSGASSAAAELQRRHEEADFDDEVIWRELGDWYASELTGAGAVGPEVNESYAELRAAA